MSSTFKPGDRVRRADSLQHGLPENSIFIVVEVQRDGYLTLEGTDLRGCGGIEALGDDDWVANHFELVEAAPDDGDQSGHDFDGAEELAELLEASTVILPASASILTEALQITQGTRNATHGAKERSFGVIARLWNVYIDGRKEGRDEPLTTVDVAQLMVLLKIARSIQGEPVRDHYVDQAGYSAVAGELAEAA